MQKLHFLAATAVILGTTACPTIDPFDDLGTDSFTTIDTANDEIDTSGTESGTDGAETTAGTTDATTTTGDTTDGGCGGFGCDCVDSSTCDPGLECNGGVCGQPMVDTTDETTDTGGLGDCDPDNEYCLPNGCMSAMGQGLTLDTNMDGMADLGWCQFVCMDMDASTCPLLEGADVQCVPWNAEGDQACFPTCDLANDTCPVGMVCFDAGGAGICMSDAEGFG